MTPAFHDNEGPPPVGYFTYSLVGDHWSWSDGMYSLHGFERGDVTPSTAVLLAHLHPDDRTGVYEVLDNAMRAATPFTCYHRVIDRDGQEHSVLLVGRGVRDDRGLVERLEGYVVDIAPQQTEPLASLGRPSDRGRCRLVRVTPCRGGMPFPSSTATGRFAVVDREGPPRSPDVSIVGIMAATS